jgi:hypothetical protein
MTKLKDIINKIDVYLLGNRVTALGILAMCAGIYGFINSPAVANPGKHILWGKLIASLTFDAGFFLTGTTAAGLTTRKFYRKTMQHINEHGKLDERYINTILSYAGTEGFVECNDQCTGYCQIQGIYLAARDMGQLDVFRECKRKNSKNWVPNF